MKDYTNISQRYAPKRPVLNYGKPNFFRILFKETIFWFGLVWEIIPSIMFFAIWLGKDEMETEEFYMIVGFVGIFHLIGIGIMVGTFFTALKYVSIYSNGIDASGVIIKKSKISRNEYSGTKTYSSFLVEYDIHGKKYKFYTRNLDMDRVSHLDEGSYVKIKYDPKKPNRAIWVGD